MAASGPGDGGMKFISHVAPVCNWPGCKAVVDSGLWACQPHWSKLPPEIRDKVEAYTDATKVAREWAIEHMLEEVEQLNWCKP